MAKTSHEIAIEFAVEITELCSKIKGRPEYTKQLIRSASSISANIAEAKYAESNADFVHKLEIAQKEANETDYWLRLLYKTEYLTVKEYDSINNDVNEIVSILKTTKGGKNSEF